MSASASTHVAVKTASTTQADTSTPFPTNNGKRILVVIGTPLADTLGHALAKSYVTAARQEGAHVQVIDLATDPIPTHPTHAGELRVPRSSEDLPLAPDAARYIDQLEWSEHLVIFFPQWWGTYPAALKAFIDRVFLSGSAFSRRPQGKLWNRLLAGRSARIVMTMDSPRLWNAVRYRNAAEISLKNAIFSYTGIRTRGITRFASVRYQRSEKYQRWFDITAAHGRKDAKARRRKTLP